jgi:hypothetical protein
MRPPASALTYSQYPQLTEVEARLVNPASTTRLPVPLACKVAAYPQPGFA